MQRERASLLKFHATRGLAAAVMGNPDYHASPCIIICPFGSCRCYRTRLTPSPSPTLPGQSHDPC